jgi:hypothetical protein
VPTYYDFQGSALIQNRWSGAGAPCVRGSIALRNSPSYPGNCFSGKIDRKKSSHCVVRDERLKGYSEFDPFGEFVISKKHGQRVLGYQLQTLARAI